MLASVRAGGAAVWAARAAGIKARATTAPRIFIADNMKRLLGVDVWHRGAAPNLGKKR
jgi:hypothetical protein